MSYFEFPTSAAGQPNMIRTQEIWDAIERGELKLDELADDVVVDNGPGAGPRPHIESEVAFFTFVMKFVRFFKAPGTRPGVPFVAGAEERRRHAGGWGHQYHSCRLRKRPKP